LATLLGASHRDDDWSGVDAQFCARDNTKMEISAISAIPLVDFRATPGSARRGSALQRAVASRCIPRTKFPRAEQRIARKPAWLSQTRAMASCRSSHAIIHSDVLQRPESRAEAGFGGNRRESRKTAESV
jgi:hypothetical protein